MDLTIVGLFDRARFARAADCLAVAAAMALPWSTSVAGILIALWLIAVFRRSISPRFAVR